MQIEIRQNNLQLVNTAILKSRTNFFSNKTQPFYLKSILCMFKKLIDIWLRFNHII